MVRLLQGIVREEAASMTAGSGDGGGGDTDLGAAPVDDPSPYISVLLGSDPTGDVLELGNQFGEEEIEVDESDATITASFSLPSLFRFYTPLNFLNNTCK